MQGGWVVLLASSEGLETGWLTGVLLGFARGGAEWVLWLLVALSVASIAVFLERLWFLRQASTDVFALRDRVMALGSDADRDALFEALASEASMESRVLANGLKEHRKGSSSVEELCRGAIGLEKIRYERGLSLLATVGSNAPFIGLFGTVMGVIMAFDELRGLDGGAAAGSAGVMGAIAEALIATGVGLLVAIPAIIFFNVLKGRVQRTVASTDLLVRTLLSDLKNREQR